MTGIDTRKEKRTAVSLFSPSQRAEVIVAPLREMPGIMAIPCATLIRSASIAVIVASFFLPGRRYARV